jgi:carbon monoxide dehydrogenase subunit G
MSTVIKEVHIDAPAGVVWDALRDFGAVHERLVPGFVVTSTLDGDVRTVTFFNGAVAREVLVGVDDSARRLAYSVIDSGLGFTVHMATAQVTADGDGACRFTWTADLLPDSAAGRVESLMTMGIGVIKQTMESGVSRECCETGLH